MGKRILVISDTIIMPLDRGNRKRVYNQINMMREHGCDVDMLYLATYPEEDPTATREFMGEDHFIVFENKKRTLGVFLKRKVRKALELMHIPGLMFKYWTVDEKISPDVVDYVKNLFTKKQYDVVIASYIYTSKALLGVPSNVVTAIDTMNAFTFKRQMYEEVGYKNYEFALTKEREKAGLMRADYTIAIQEDEGEFFKSILPSDKKVVTIGENMPVAEPYVANTNTILFLGSYYVVNRHGVKHFIEHIIPLLKKSGVPFKVKLAGSICKHIPDGEDYEKLGYVDDVDEAYREARLVINPVLVGTGLNIKTIEAVSKAKPLVSHEVGVRGLKPEKPFALVSDDDQEFANHIIELLKSDEKCLELSQNAVDFMNQYIEKNNSALEEIFNAEK